MANWGGIIAQGALGAVAGGAQSLSDDITARQKEEMETRRQQQLSRLRMEEHAANTQVSSDIALKGHQRQAASDLEFATANRDTLAANSASKTAAETTARKQAEIDTEFKNQDKVSDIEMNKVLAHAAAVAAAKTPEEKAMEKAKLDHEIAAVGLSKAQAAHAYAQAGLENAKSVNETLKDPNAKEDAKAKPTNEDTVDAGEDAKGRKMRRGKVSGWKLIEDPGLKDKPEVPGGIINTLSMGKFGDAGKPAQVATNPRTIYLDPEGNEKSKDDYEAALADVGRDRKAAAKPNRTPTDYASQYTDIADATSQARAAIAAGANRAIIAKRFKDATGKNLPF